MKDIWTTYPLPPHTHTHTHTHTHAHTHTHTHTHTHMPNKIYAPLSALRINYFRSAPPPRTPFLPASSLTESEVKSWKSDVRIRKLEVIKPEVETLEVESREVRNSHLTSGSLLFFNFSLHLLPLDSAFDSFRSSYFRLLTSYSQLLVPIF